MTRKTLTTLGLIVALVAIFCVSFAVGGLHTDADERFPGTDSVASAAIEEAVPGFQPWFEPPFQPESGEVESGLFALQAGLGGSVLGFAIGALWGRRHRAAPLEAPGEHPVPDRSR